MNNKKVTVLISADSNYIDYAYTLIKLLRDVHIGNYLGHVSLVTPKGIALGTKFEELVKEGSNFSHFEIEYELYTELRMTPSHLTKSAYSRLFLEDLIPTEFTHCLYLDVDLIVQSDINPIFSLDIPRIALALPYRSGEIPTTNARFQDFKEYFNSGVMWIDLRRWRSFDVKDKSLTILSKFGPFEYADQDVLNLVLKNSWDPLIPKFNYLYPASNSQEKIDFPVIVHFAGQGKPWNRSTGGKYGNIWRKSHKKNFPSFRLPRFAYWREKALVFKEFVYRSLYSLIKR